MSYPIGLHCRALYPSWDFFLFVKLNNDTFRSFVVIGFGQVACSSEIGEHAGRLGCEWLSDGEQWISKLWTFPMYAGHARMASWLVLLATTQTNHCMAFLLLLVVVNGGGGGGLEE